jgi:hypothetical protein
LGVSLGRPAAQRVEDETTGLLKMIRLAEELLDEPGGSVIEVVGLLHRWEPDQRVSFEVGLEPGRPGFARANAQEIRVHSPSVMESR